LKLRIALPDLAPAEVVSTPTTIWVVSVAPGASDGGLAVPLPNAPAALTVALLVPAVLPIRLSEKPSFGTLLVIDSAWFCAVPIRTLPKLTGNDVLIDGLAKRTTVPLLCTSPVTAGS